MQKNTRKASILIWAIFLSIIISVSFIEISTKINKNLKNNKNIINNIQLDLETENIINKVKISKNFTEQKLSNGDKITFEKTNDLIVSLKHNDKHLSKINSNSNINITILEGGPITYKNNTLSGIIFSTSSIDVTKGDLELYNIGGFTRVKILSSKTTNYLSQYNNYRIIKKMGNKEFIKTKGKIKSF